MRLRPPLATDDVFLKALDRYYQDMDRFRSDPPKPARASSSVDLDQAIVNLRGSDDAILKSYSFRLDRIGRLRFRPLWG